MLTDDPSSALEYHFTVDVRCRIKDGQHFLVKIQNDFRDNYQLKALLEHSAILSLLDKDQDVKSQLKRRKGNIKDTNSLWKGITGIYTIIITNKAFGPKRMKLLYSDEPLLKNPYELLHMKQLDCRYGDVPNKIILLMLDHLHKHANELLTPIEDWAYVLKDEALRSGVETIPVTKELVDIDVIANRNPGIKEFVERLNVNNLPQEVRDRYFRTVDYYNATIMDIQKKGFEEGFEKGTVSGLEKGRKKGEKEGRKKGKKEGKLKGLLKAALGMKRLKIPLDQIVTATGLSEAEIDDIDA